MKLQAFAAVAAIVVAFSTSSAIRALEPDDLLNRRIVWRSSLSADGSWLAYSVAVARVGPEESRWDSQIWLSSVDGDTSFQLTRGDEDAFDPAWSPDGRLLAFRSARGGEEVALWLIRPTGGEAWRLSDVEGAVGSYRWSPDGSSIAFVATDPPDPERTAAEKALDDPLVVEGAYRFDHLHRVSVDAEADAPVAATRITGGDFHVVGFDWSPDGNRLVFTHHPTPRAFEWRNSDLSVVPSTGGEPVSLVRSPGMDTGPQFSPDGRFVAFVSDRGRRTWARDWRLCLVPSDGGTVRVLPETYGGMPGEDLEGGVVGWSADGRSLYYTELEGTSVHLYRMPIDGGSYQRVTSAPGNKFSFTLSADTSQVAYVREDFELPSEAWIRPTGDGAPRQVSGVNTHLPALPAVHSEEVRWRSFDGLEIEGLLHLPPGYRPGTRLPLLVELHGGPTWAFLRTYGLYDRQLVVRGFALLQVNPRGSDGYGRELRLANLGDWGGKDVKDVLAGVDHLVATGIADPERLGVFGWSYGGFLTGQTISHSQRFKAAVVGAGITHLASFAGTTDITGFVPSFLQSELWNQPELWRDRSTVYHAGEIVTPTLIVHGENDVRVPVTQAYELYRALQSAGVETQLVVYPRSGHGVNEPKLALDLLRRQIAWFEEHLLARRQARGPLSGRSEAAAALPARSDEPVGATPDAPGSVRGR
ncbi:MAG: S9 family peptidase [Holophagales bacterium]|nr:S9 family peptidase [Holophagales bacterium]